jgi:anti-sigma regulatory factor (Ser/Thr protein kinase)
MRTRVTRSGGPTRDVRFCLVFPREALSIPVMRRVLGDTLGRLGLDEDSISDLLLAVTEACTNVLLHSGPGHPYVVVARVGRDRCMLEVLDGARGLDPAKAPAQRHAAGWAYARFRRRGTASAAAHSAKPALFAAAALRGRIARAGGGRAGGGRGDAAEPGRGHAGAAAERDIAQLPESGRGLAIMRACVDNVTMRSTPDHGTVVSLRKRIELRSDAPLAHPETGLRDAG